MPLLQFVHLSLGRDSATVKRMKCNRRAAEEDEIGGEDNALN
jgi:hypothetical protein